MTDLVARALSVAVLLLFLTGTNTSASQRRDPPIPRPPALTAALTDKPQYVVMLVLDGALPSYFKLADFPHLRGLIRTGTQYSRAWDGMLESETPTGHATLGTGSLPRRHGVISFGWVTDRNVQQQPTNPIPLQHGQLEELLHQSGVPSIASLLKQHDRSARVVVTSGHKDYAVDAVGGWAADYLMYYAVRNQIWTPLSIPRHVPPRSVLQAPGLTTYAPHLYPGQQDSLAVRLALTAFQQIHQRVTIVNLPEFDWPLGHLLGAGADRWMAWRLMVQLDNDVATIESTYAQARVLKKTLFVLTADHGMLTLNHLIPHEVIQNAVKSAGASTSDYEFHSAGYLWIREPAKIPLVAEKLVALHNPHILAVYYRQPHTYQYTRERDPLSHVSPALDGAYRFLLSTFAGPRAPHVVLFLTENTGISGRNQVGWRGDHGGPSWNAEHIPLVLSGPGVRMDVTSSYPATLYDVAPTVLSLLGVQPRGMDGVTLDDALTNPDDAGVAAQQNRARNLDGIVQALIARSQQDGR
ncbi:MAG: alkaline phosphatase family protein [Chloroflexota bacterium]